jgi:outer membrane lipoprotein-sorting protein
MTRKWLRWMPAVAVPAVIAAGVLSGSLPASAGDPLPEKTPQQVLLMIAQHDEKSLSGTLEQSSAIGLPELPKSGPGAGSPETAWLELLTGPHTARIYLDGPENARVQIMDRMAERDAIKNGRELWFYNSKDNTAAHAQLPADAASRHQAQPGTVPTPAELADQLLAKVDASTDVTVGPDTQVAGRAAYKLVLTPKSDATLVESIAIAVDGETGLPLGVELRARGQSEPAFSVAFTSLNLDTPDSSIFTFTPPPGATVKEIPLPDHNASAATPPADSAQAKAAKRPAVTGTGWESVLEFPAGAIALPGGTSLQTGAPDPATANPLRPDPSAPEGSRSGAAALLEQAAVAVPGGRLVSTSLVNVLILDDGRILAGSVPVERLQAAALGK